MTYFDWLQYCLVARPSIIQLITDNRLSRGRSPDNANLSHLTHTFKHRSVRQQVNSQSKDSIYIATWWRHQMETFSALLAICAGNSSVPVNSPHKGQWRGALMFSLISTSINGWVNNREAGDLRRNRTHYDVIVMNGALLSHRLMFFWDRTDISNYMWNLR